MALGRMIRATRGRRGKAGEGGEGGRNQEEGSIEASGFRLQASGRS